MTPPPTSSPRVLLAAVLAVLVLGPVPGTAGPVVGTIGPGWFGTSNTDLVATLPLNSGTAGARVVDGDRLLVTDQNGLTVYDIADPTLPVPLGFTPIPQQYYFTEEDVPSNGRIALVGQYGDLTPAIRLNVVDVSLDGPLGQPRVIGTLDGVDEHTFECARDCTYAYGSSGAIIDLTDPTTPRDVGEWDDAVRAQADPVTGQPYAFAAGTHDVTEVAPGILLTSSNPMFLLDVRTTPAQPQVIGVGTFADRRFVHANLWPYRGALPADPADPAADGWEPDWAAFDRHVLVGGETAPLPQACDQADGAFMTVPWAVTELPDGRPFVRMTFDPAAGSGHEHRPEPGVLVDGGAAYSQYCAHWFTTQPGYADGGLVAMGWYEYGTRFLEVADDGAITERGWLLPLGGSTSAAYWVDRDTVLTADYQRGVDVLAFDDTVPPEDVRPVSAPGTRFERAVLPRPAVLEDWYTGFGCPLPS